LNRLSTKAPSGQATVTYLYDLSGRLLSATTPVVSGNPATGAFSFSHDTAGRLIQEETPDSKLVKYGLDKNSNLTKLTYPDGYYVTRVYDQLNRLTTIELDGATTAAVGITYDELSRRAVLTYANGVTSTYTFQLNNDLTTLAEAFVGSAVTLTYGFNKVHQETSRAVTDGTYLWHPGAGGTTTYAAANTINEYPTVGGASYQYDGNGNLKSDGTWTYVYDTENHLLSASKTGVSASYVYDGLHRQIQKTISSTSTRYYYGGWQRLADYNGTTLQNRYVYGTGLDEALIEVSGAGVLTYLHADRLGSVVATTNSAGAVVNKTAYGPSGEGSPPSGISFGFTGQRYDNETGLCYYKRRLYSPSIGRFLQPDPLGNAAGLNLYLYNWSDPLCVARLRSALMQPLLIPRLHFRCSQMDRQAEMVMQAIFNSTQTPSILEQVQLERCQQMALQVVPVKVAL
jgi:RHS repeat-associated protein